MDYDPIKVAVVGYGFSAQTFHLPFINTLEQFELAAISSSKKEQVLADWPQATYFSSAEQLIQESDAELVIITAPNDVHYSLAKLALENDKHVIIEKPFVTRVADGESLIHLAEEKQRVLSVFQNRRWDSDFLTLKKVVEDGQIGEVKFLDSHFDRFRPDVRQRWREQAQDGGGILFDLGAHLIDQAVVLFGQPSSVTAQCLNMRPGCETVDFFNVILHYKERLVQLHGNLYSPEPNVRYKALGTKGKFLKFGLDPQEPQLISGMTPADKGWAVESSDNHGVIYHEDNKAEEVISQVGGYEHYFMALADAIRTGTANPVPAQESLNTIRIIEAAMESSQTGHSIKL